MIRRLVFSASLLLVLTLTLTRATPGQAAGPGYKVTGTIGIPAPPMLSHDFMRDDRSTNLVFQAEGTIRGTTNGNTRLDVFNALTGVPVAAVPLAGGAHDIGIDDNLGVAFVSIGGGSLAKGETAVQVVNLKTYSVVATIDTTPPNATASIADLAGYDPRDHIFAVGLKGTAHGEVVFLSVSATGGSIAGTLTMPDVNATTVDSPEGVLWDPGTQMFYIAGEKTNTILPVRPVAPFTAGKPFSAGCPAAKGATPTPHGLALGPNENVAVGCDSGGESIINLVSGKVVSSKITQVTGTDEPSFDPVTSRYFFPGNPTSGNTHADVLGVADAKTNTWIENDATGGTPDNTQGAVDPGSGRFFFPLNANVKNTTCPGGCVAIFSVPAPTTTTTAVTRPTSCTPTTSFSNVSGFQGFTTECATSQTTPIFSTTTTCGTGLGPTYIISNPLAVQNIPTTNIQFTTIGVAGEKCPAQQFP